MVFEDDRLMAEQVRNVSPGDYLVVKLHEDEYWLQGEGRVEYVQKYDSGNVVVAFSKGGPTSKLRVPADARSGLRLDGVARGANYLRVDGVYHVKR